MRAFFAIVSALKALSVQRPIDFFLGRVHGYQSRWLDDDHQDEKKTPTE